MAVLGPRFYQALLGGITILMGLLFLSSRLFVYYNRYNDDLGLSIFNGKLPSIPEYDSVTPEVNIPDSAQHAPSTQNTPSESLESPSPTSFSGSSASLQEFDPAWNNKSTWPQWSKSQRPTDPTVAPPTNHMLHEEVDKYVHSILDFGDKWPFDRVSCPAEIGARYQKLRDEEENRLVRYFFALNLHEAVDALPQLMSSIFEAVKYLGAKHCAVSIVDNESQDGTWEILEALKPWLDSMDVPYFLASSRHSLSRRDDASQATLADLRNQALEPLKATGEEPVQALSSMYSPEAVVIFLDNIVLCPEDILELVFQHINQGAQMTCAFDWAFNGTVFFDVWESRSLAGNTFFEIQPDGSLLGSNEMFFDDQPNKLRFDDFQPLQVYSCWGGMATLNAVSFAEDVIRFRPAEQTEADCYMSETVLLAKDLFSQGLGKILAVPSVNVAYSDNEATEMKHTRGYVHDHVDSSRSALDEGETVQWQPAPPDMIKCLAHSDQVAWTEWIESI
ncbi:hypothetical protein N7466_008389 [Penicillium verhagenii]|uniref:uncharacterized protein n=1 Tax=Penicillium verhagenii TaxID=1562060 RepID=UPI002545B82F|nr:uncharacterized protein N7466_008389 [Penicillium verhagenii]KAJ5924202.1 hypothetical protein N7466_008389 [Penicillium verhagenii]